MSTIELDKPVDILEGFGIKEAGGSDVAKPGLKPADVVAAEEAAAGGGTKPGGTETAVSTATAPLPPVKVGEVDLDQLAKKIENKEALTSAELEAWKVVNAPPPPPAPEKKYRVAGEEFTRGEALQKARDHFSSILSDEIVLTPEAETKLIEDWHKLQNRSAQQVTVQVAQEQNARDRKEIEVAREHNRQLERELEARRMLLKRDEDALLDRKAKLAQEAANPMTAENIQTEEDRRVYYRKLDAIEALRVLPETEKNLIQQKSELNRQSVRTMLEGFVAVQPEYKTSEPLETVISKMRSGQPVAAEDKTKVLELDQLMREAVASETSIEDQFVLRQAQQTLAVPKLRRTAQPSGSGIGTSTGTQEAPLDLNTQPKSPAELVRQFKERSLKNPDLIGGSGVGGDNRQSPIPTAKEIVRAGQQAMGVHKDEDRARLKSLGLDF